jgi:hypothetical protein
MLTMTRRAVLLAILLTLTAFLGLVVMTIQRATTAGPVFSVATVQSGLRSNPYAWLGRTVRVRGAGIMLNRGLNAIGQAPPIFLLTDVSVLDSRLLPRGAATQSTPRTTTSRIQFVPYGLPAIGSGLLVHYGVQDPLWAMLRRLPGLGALAPQPQHFDVRTNPVIYRIRLQPVAGDCGPSPCYHAVLVDAAPL